MGDVVDAMHSAGCTVRLFQSPFVWWAEFCRNEINPLPALDRESPRRRALACRAAALETLRLDQGP